MASIVKEVAVDAPGSGCWDALRDFAALHERLAKGFVTDTVMVGTNERQVTFFNGAIARERLVGVDEDFMRLAYTVVESPLHSSHYNGAAQIFPVNEGQCRFLWAVDVLPDDLAQQIDGMMVAGVRAIKQTLEAGSP
jgi:hypothetical protein